VRKMEVPGADFDMIVLMSKAQVGAMSGLSAQEHSWPPVRLVTGSHLRRIAISNGSLAARDR